MTRHSGTVAITHKEEMPTEELPWNGQQKNCCMGSGGGEGEMGRSPVLELVSLD